MADYRDQWWGEVDNAANLLASLLGSFASRAQRDGTYTPVPGSTATRREPGSLRHIEEIIRANRWYTGADKDVIGGLFRGRTSYLTNPSLVIAVARACHAIVGEDFTVDDAQQLILASQRIQLLIADAKAADERIQRSQLALRATTDVVDTSIVLESNDDANTDKRPIAVARPIIHAPRRRRRSRARWIAAAVLISVATLTASGVLTGILPWPWSTTTSGNPDYRIPVPRPTQQELDNDPQHCADRSAVVDTGDKEASGSIRLHECQDSLEISIADLDRDSRCIYADIIWSPQSSERSNDACPVGRIVTQRFPKRTNEYHIELVSTFRP